MSIKSTRNGTGKAKPSVAERRQAIRGLVRMVSSEDPFVSVSATRAVVDLGEAAVGALAEHIHQAGKPRDRSLVIMLILGLSKEPDSRVTEAIQRAANEDPDESVREAAAYVSSVFVARGEGAAPRRPSR